MASNTENNKTLFKSVQDIPIVPSKDALVMKDENNKPGPRSIILDYCLNTSTHGLWGIVRSESLLNRVFWSISFVAFTVLMAYFLVSATLDYFGYPTNMDINVVNEWPQYFPAFSLCNASPLRMDQFIGPFLNYTNANNLTNTNDTTTLSLIEAGYIWNYMVNRINDNQPVEPLLFSLSSMLYSCFFNSQPCSAADFIPFTSSIYGLCYTFNAKLKNTNGSNVRYSNQNGGNGELDLSLYVYSNQYVPYVSDGIGIIALIHDNTELPLIETSGIALAPGRKHILGYKKKTIFFLPSPYTTCTSEISLQMNAMLENYNGADYGYDETTCQELCEQVYAYEQCGCVNPNRWNARSIVLPGTNKLILVPLCNANDLCYQTAANELLNSTRLMNKYCTDCAGQCSITDFLVDISSFTTPLEWQMDGIKAFVENSTIPLPENWSTIWREQIHANYLQINVIRETTIVENYTQTAKIKLVDLISNIGGQTSLWIGMSFLSLMELIEMIYRLIRYSFHATRCAGRITPQ